MHSQQRGFTLIELIAVLVLVGIMSVVLMSRIGGANTAGVQAGRDSLIAAFFFAQQTAMARDGIQLTTSGNNVNVTEDGDSLIGYPLTLSDAVTLTSSSFTYDKLGRTSSGNVTISHSSGTSATITVEESGYAHY